MDFEEARAKADKSVLEAEKFRATIANPDTGTVQNIITNDQTDSNLMMSTVSNGTIPNIGSGVSDDDFCHLTCHIEPNLIHMIEKGQFVELEKLLPKEKLGRNGEENRLEWVQRDGGTFLVPVQRDSKISSFRRWEQASRAYATIYCGAHPHRLKEIWQYISVINTAASSYLWDNVYNYNITFRHLMAFNPQRSWAVTYNQMSNLSMRNPIPKGGLDTSLVMAAMDRHNPVTKTKAIILGERKNQITVGILTEEFHASLVQNVNLLKGANTVIHHHME